ncbi:MAG: hypothetical protein VYC32_12195, partial [Planctomycetota bacterium]|nr:hypothetical protein [Planctomycetota bacterium]
ADTGAGTARADKRNAADIKNLIGNPLLVVVLCPSIQRSSESSIFPFLEMKSRIFFPAARRASLHKPSLVT